MLAFLNVFENEVIRSYLEELYLLYRKDLVYEANKILKDHHEAEDIVQTAFIKVADYLDENIDVKCKKTKGLMVIIVRNLSINQYNKRKRRATANIDDLTNVISEESEVTSEINILRLDQSQEVARLLDNINEGYADILILKYLYEYTDKEIAEILSMSEGSTGSTYHVDTEDAETKEVPIGNTSGYLIDKNDGITLFWNEENMDFMFNGNIEPNELIKIAESLEKNK